ncbi:MAG: Low affinity potassium transport system protein kup, partial [Alphaproteobacteria bacterium]|nr:Low affinity potassium transport system protein kup [Alphaproteobacteria bacterium]
MIPNQPELGEALPSVSDPLAAAPPLVDGGHSHAGDRKLLGLMLGAMGVVFGDIGTSPLYALKATVLATEGGLPNHVAVMGSLS